MARLSHGGPVGLLVSVRSEAEGAAALAGGARVIDLKEPLKGPLGGAPPRVVASVARRFAGRRPVTAAVGELIDRAPGARWFPEGPHLLGVSLVKTGLSRMAGEDWPALLQRAGREDPRWPIAPVAYADHRRAASPSPRSVVQQAARNGWPWVVLDTWDKRSGDLFDHLEPAEAARLIDLGRRGGVSVVLAGGLNGESLSVAARLGPALVGVRGAACNGGRDGEIDPDRVAVLAALLRSEGAGATIGV